MREIRLYCDFCGKEVESYGDFEDLEFDYKGGGRDKFEVCRDCFLKVRNYALLLRERRTDEKDNM